MFRLIDCISPIWRLQILLSTVLVLSSWQAHADLITYKTTPGAQASSNYKLTVNGKSVFVERFGDVSYARFAFSESASIRVTPKAFVAGASISPLSYNIAATTDTKSLSFMLTQPRKLIVTVAGQEKLLIFADGPELSAPKPGDARVTDIATYIAQSRDTSAPVTAQLQQAINEVSASNGGAGGVLYLGPGLYMSTQLTLRSNVSLYLDSGALLRAVPNFTTAGYPIQNGADSSFIYIPNAKNVTISGRGVIDGNGFALRTNTPGGGNCKLLRTKSSRQIAVEDVLFRDSARWSFHVLGSDNVAFRGVKLVNDLRITSGSQPFVTNTDAFDVDASSNVLVERSFVYTGDDAFTPKATNYMGILKPAHDLVFRDNIIWTFKVALKVGSEILNDIHNVSFRNNDVVMADRFFAVWNEGGSWVHDVDTTGNRTETIGVADHKAFFYHYIRNLPGLASNLVTDGLYARRMAPGYSRIEGFNDTHRMGSFAIRNMYVANVPMSSAASFDMRMKNNWYKGISVTAPSNSAVPTVSVSAPDDCACTAVDTATYTFSRSGALDTVLPVNFIVSGSAVAGRHYTLPSRVTFGPGAQQVSLVLAPIPSSLAAGERKAVDLKLEADNAYTIGADSSASVTLVGSASNTSSGGNNGETDGSDGELPVLTVTIQDGSASEIQSPPNPGKFKINRTGDKSSALLVRIKITGTATNGMDYPKVGDTVIIPAGSSFSYVQINPYADALVEKIESVILSLSTDETYETAGNPAMLMIAK